MFLSKQIHFLIPKWHSCPSIEEYICSNCSIIVWTSVQVLPMAVLGVDRTRKRSMFQLRIHYSPLTGCPSIQVSYCKLSIRDRSHEDWFSHCWILLYRTSWITSLSLQVWSLSRCLRLIFKFWQDSRNYTVFDADGIVSH